MAMDLVAHLDFTDDPHMVAILCDRLSNKEGSFWKVSVAGHGIIEICFDHSLDKHLFRDQVLWIWGMTFLEPKYAVASLSVGARISFRPPHLAKTSDGCIAELFSGFAGWTHGARLLGKEVSYMVEIDEHTAKAASVATGIPVFQFEDTWKQFLCDGSIPQQAIFIGDANDDRIWTILSIMNVRHVLFSTNCQPWSSIGHQRGLHVQMGLNTPAMFRKGRDYAMATMTLENVKGFRSHPHYHVVMTFAEKMGFDCIHQDIDNCDGVLPLIRERWLGTFVDRGLSPHISPEVRTAAKQLHLPSNPFLGGLIGYGALFHTVPEHHLNELVPDEEALRKLSDPHFIPHWWENRKPDSLNCRVVPNNKPWKGLVASYGRQHQLDFDLLHAKGLHTCLLKSPAGPRYISPWEAAAALGLPCTIRFPADLHLCWQLVGNGISIAHVLLQLSRLHMLCGHLSPFASVSVPSLANLCRAMHRTGLQLAEMTPAIVGHHRVLMNSAGEFVGEKIESDCAINEPVDAIVDPVDQELGEQEILVVEEHPRPPFDHDFLRPSKWLKTHGFEVSPTIPYEVTTVDDKPNPKFGLQHLPAPSLRELLGQCRIAQQSLCKRIDGEVLHIVIFASSLSRWTVLTWAPHGKTVAKLFMFVLPHFKPELVKHLIDHDIEVACDSIPYANPFRVIRFCPVDVLCKIHLTCDQNQVVVHPANLTTKCSDWICEFAARFNIPTCMLVLRCHEKEVPNDTFILALPGKTFSLHWVVPYHVPAVKPIVDGRLEPLDFQASSQFGTAQGDDNPKNVDGMKCFAARHPIWKTIRTVAKPLQTPISEVINCLFPDLVATCEPIIDAGGIIVPPSTKTSDMPNMKSFVVELNGDRPLPTLTLFQVPVQVGLCLFPDRLDVGDQPFRRWVRTPFKVQTFQVELPGALTLLELGSSFFAQITSAQTVQVTINHKLVDPCLTIREVSSTDTIDFRICPLPGGAKTTLPMSSPRPFAREVSQMMHLMLGPNLS